MYDDPNADPNLDREDVPFPTQNGPPRFQAQHSAPQQQSAGIPAEPHRGNGHAAYAQQVQQQAPRQTYPVGQSELSLRLANVNAGFQVGSAHVAELWANQLQLFRAEFHRLTGREISDREAFDMVTAPLFMAMD